MISDRTVANAVGGKTARACDSCIRKRARWYCAADDAFLCQGCDSSVHSANPLARRHERVRLKTASLKPSREDSVENLAPSWHRGFTRKARTPRQGKPGNHQTSKSEESRQNSFPLVPEIGIDEISQDENEEQLLYRVPIFDPFVAGFCTTTTTSNEAAATVANDAETAGVIGSESKAALLSGYGQDGDNLHGFLPSEMDLAEFAADVESLLGRGLENESFGMEGLGLLDCKEKDSDECCLGSGRVKVEEDDEMEAVTACHAGTDIDMMREPFELNFDYDSPATCEEEDEKVAAGGATAVKISRGYEEDDVKKKKKKKNILLTLDYEAVITAWASQGCPWTTGSRPEIDPDECWPACVGTCGSEVHHPYPYGDLSGIGGQTTMGDGGREARVSRYREKRRTRLFSKKIRYEVRKLNAEKRPRMKGRFVKRASFTGPVFPLLNK